MAKIVDYPALIARLTTGNPDGAEALAKLVGNDREGKLLIEQVLKVDPTGHNEARPLELISSDSILSTDWPEPVWAIPNLLPTGLTILAGAPKLGKSWLALQIAQAVAAGGRVFGEPVQPGPIMYLALEDPARRLKERMGRQGWRKGLPAEFMTIGNFETELSDLNKGGGEKLARQIERCGYRLVVIDTLSRAVKGDQNNAEEMTAGLTPLQEIAHSTSAAILLIDHHRKGTSGDFADAIGDILGSTAKGAMADSTWGLYRERGKAGAKLSVTGRDITEKTLALNMDWVTGAWQCEGDADELAITQRRQEIIEALREVDRPAQVGEIAKLVEQPPSNTFTRLQDMAGAGLVKRIKQGNKVLYALP